MSAVKLFRCPPLRFWHAAMIIRANVSPSRQALPREGGVPDRLAGIGGLPGKDTMNDETEFAGRAPDKLVYRSELNTPVVSSWLIYQQGVALPNKSPYFREYFLSPEKYRSMNIKGLLTL